MNFCTATLLGCCVHQTPSCPAFEGVRCHLEEQLLGVDVVDQAGVVLVHHGQLAAGRAHVQAAHGRGLLQQHDGQGVVHKDLQDLQQCTPSHSTQLRPYSCKLHGAQELQCCLKCEAFSEKNCSKFREMLPVWGLLSRLAATACSRSQAHTDKSDAMHPAFSTSYTSSLIQEYITYRRHTASQLPCYQYLWAPVGHFQLPPGMWNTAPTSGEQPHPHKCSAGNVYTPSIPTKGKPALCTKYSLFISWY